MAILFSSAFQVRYPTDGQMVIVDPPSLWIVVFWYAVALFGLLALVGSFRTRSRSVRVVGAILLLTGGFVGWISSTSSSVAIDKGAGTVTFHSGWPGAGDDVRPLGELKYATVETDTGAYRLVFITEGGSRRSLGPYSGQSGQPEAAFAINHFLGLESPHATGDVEKSTQQSGSQTTIHFKGQDTTLTLADARQIEQALQTYLDLHKEDQPPNLVQDLPKPVAEVWIDSEGNIRMGPWLLEARDDQLVLVCRLATRRDAAGKQYVAHLSNADDRWLVTSITHVILFPRH